MTVEPSEAPAALALANVRALDQSPTEASLDAAIVTATQVGRRLAAEAVPNPVGLAAIQLLRGTIETLRGEALASLSSEVAVLLARNIRDSDLSEHLLVEALLCAVRSHRAANQLKIARVRATEALAVAEVGLDRSHPATAACWTELGKTCEAMGDITAASAAYREVLEAGGDKWPTTRGRHDPTGELRPDQLPERGQTT